MGAFDPLLTIDELNKALGCKNIIIEKQIGDGGQGDVFKAKANNQDIALKIYNLIHTNVVRVEREIQALKKLQSNYIAKLILFDDIEIRENNCKIIAYDYIDGANLEQILSGQSTLPSDVVKKICFRIVSVLDDLWRLRIVHRDVNPKNIMMDKAMNSFLIDLGIARHIEEGTITNEGWTIGTNGYMSPEHISARKSLTIKSDIFELGIVLYSCLKGKHPFKSSNLIILKAIKPDDLNLKDPLEKLINDMLEFSPVNRPNSIEILKQIT